MQEQLRPKAGIPKHIHIYRQNIAYKQMSRVLRTAVVRRYGGISICLKLPYGPQNTVNIAGTIAQTNPSNEYKIRQGPE